MTVGGDSEAQTAPARREEIGLLLKIALPLSAAYLAELAMFVITKMVVGRLGYLELAAVGLAGEVAFEIMVILMGMLSIIGVLVAQAEGRGRPRDAGHAARQGLVVATLVGLPASVVIWYLPSLLALTAQDPAVLALTVPYAHALAGFLLPTLYFAVLRNFVAALARTGAILAITALGAGLSFLLAVGLVTGAFGLPALGVAGAGWATTIVAWAMLAALVFYVYRAPFLRGYGLFAARLRIDLAACAEIARLGVPVAALVLIEAGLFMSVSVLSGVLGAEVLAAYGVVMGWVGVPFVIALGLSEATMVRVAYGAGRGSPAAARQAGLLGMAIGVGSVALLVIVPLLLPDVLTQIFLDSGDPGFAAVSALVAQLLVIVALFQIFDGLQVIASHALRGLRDTVVPLWLAGFGYWVLGIGGGSLLAFPLGHGATGLWSGLAGGLIVTGSLLAWRFTRLSGGSRLVASAGLRS